MLLSLRTIFTIVIGLLFFVGAVCLQIFLSKRESKFPGLVIPIISFMCGLLFPLSMVAPADGVTAGFVVKMIIVWLFGNIPTVIFLAIYFGCREKQRRNKQLDKMNIQDLD